MEVSIKIRQKKKNFIFLLVCVLFGVPLFAQVATYEYPTSDGEAVLSDRYKVFMKHGDGEEQELQVLMSNAIYDADIPGGTSDYRASYLEGRTFSFAQVSYDDVTGKGLTFRVEKVFGYASSSVALAPKSYEIDHSLSRDGKEITFSVDGNNKYISINFKGTDNEVNVSPQKWIKHMLCVFIDPPERDVPQLGDEGVVEYTRMTSSSTLKNAKTIYFPAGYYNLKNYRFKGNFVSANGEIQIQANQEIYLAGGAFIEGYMSSEGNHTKVFGRGILSLRQYPWMEHDIHYGNDDYVQHTIELENDGHIQGIMIMEPCFHGIVGDQNNLIEDVKILGWHCNNDAVRVSNGSVIRNSFMRAVDDFFYNFDIFVHDCVLWAGHNGSIITYGWGQEEGSTYNSGRSTLQDIDIINPEWTALANNGGLLMSNTGYEYKPVDYNTGDTMTVLRNIRVEGDIPGFINLKPRTGDAGDIIAAKVKTENVGFLGYALLENITVEGQFSKGLIIGDKDVAYDGDADYITRNIIFRNIEIGGTCVTETNKSTYFTIDEETTSDIVFEGCMTNHTITATAGENGIINSLGELPIAEGSSMTYYLDPNEDFSVADVIVDGVSQGSISQYTFENVAENHTISVSFGMAGFPYLYITNRQYYEYLVSVDGNSAFDINLNVSLGIGVAQASWAFKGAGDGYYYIENALSLGKYLTVKGGALNLDVDASDSARWIVDNTDGGWFYIENLALGTRLKSVEGDTGFDLTYDTGHRVQWTTSVSTYAAPMDADTIIARSGFGGYINPMGEVVVKENEAKTFSFTSSFGYEIDDVLVDGVSQGVISSYTFDSIAASHTIDVSFKLSSASVDNIQYGEEISISPNPANSQFTLSGVELGSFISVYDISGKVVISKQINDSDESIDVSGLSSNIYIVNVSTSDRVTNKKLIVE